MTCGFQHRRSSAALRLLGALQILLALSATVGSSAHLAFTRHVTCAEHGEWVDAGRAPTVAAAPAGARDSALSGGGEAAHGHDHCFIATLRRDQLGSAERPTVSGTTPQLTAKPEPAQATPVASAIPILALAPKSSPPA